MSLSLTPLKNAQLSLKRALAQPLDEFIRDSVIQRFEYTFELSWKTLKRYFKENGHQELDHVKDLLREAGKQSLIENVEDWFSFQRARNKTSHIYSEKVAEEVYQAAIGFAPEAEKLIERLDALIEGED